MFKNFRKCRKFYGMSKLLQRKLLKISIFSFKTLLGYQTFLMPYLHLALKSFFQFVSETYLHLALKFFSSICFWSTSIKLKPFLSLYLLWIVIIFGWFLYFKIAFKAASLVLLTKGSLFQYLEIQRFYTI